MSLRTVFALFCLTWACCFFPSPTLAATIYTGSIDVAGGDLIVGGDWTTGTLSWTVEKVGSLWSYTYVFDHDGNSPETSHAIIEVSEGVVKEDIITDHPSIAVDDFGIAPSNPGIPGSFTNGLKFDETTGNITTLSLLINRVPTWGDFYSKGGSTSFAYNSGFVAGDNNDPVGVAPHDGPEAGHILVPDTRVPEPSTGVLAMLLLFMVTCGGKFTKMRA